MAAKRKKAAPARKSGKAKSRARTRKTGTTPAKRKKAAPARKSGKAKSRARTRKTGTTPAKRKKAAPARKSGKAKSRARTRKTGTTPAKRKKAAPARKSGKAKSRARTRKTGTTPASKLGIRKYTVELQERHSLWLQQTAAKEGRTPEQMLDRLVRIAWSQDGSRVTGSTIRAEDMAED